MRVGFVIEGVAGAVPWKPGCADAVVCERFCKLIGEATKTVYEPEFEYAVNKVQLIQNVAAHVSRLVDKGCERIIVLWDERPARGEGGTPLCWHLERVEIQERLQEDGLLDDRIRLVCIERELEAWLLADSQALEAALSRPTHGARVTKYSAPEGLSLPKSALDKACRDNGHANGYESHRHPEMIMKHIHDYRRLRRCPTFVRFASKLTDLTPAVLGF